MGHESEMLELFGYYINPNMPLEMFQEIVNEVRDIEVAYFKKELSTHTGHE
jgi:RNase adaptor protein for sRNA GlmZ degradation